MKNILIISVFTLVLSIAIPFVAFSPFFNSDLSTEFPADSPQENIFNVCPHLRKIDTLDINSTFPHKIILDSCNVYDTKLIQDVLYSMDTMYPNYKLNLMIAFSSTLTDSSANKLKTGLRSETLDKLFVLLKWNNNFKALSISDDTHSMFYKVLNNYWSSFITDKLSEMASKDHDIKYNSKFKFLYSYFKSERYTANVPTTSFDKVIYNLENSRLGYLMFKFKAIFGVLGVITIALLILLTIIAYIIFIKHLIKLIKK